MDRMEVNDPELDALLKLRREVQVFQNGRDATPRTLTMGDLLEFQFGDGLDKVEEFTKLSLSRDNVGIEDLDEIVEEVSCDLNI